MTSQEAYIRLLIKCNKNNTRGNVDIDKSEFVLIYNEQQRTWVKRSKKINNSTNFTNEVNTLLTPDIHLIPTVFTQEYTAADLPDNWWKVEYSYSNCKKGDCKAKVYHWEKKTANKGDILTDAFNSPSFEWEETFTTIVDGQIQVYKTDFDVEEIVIDYYRVPRDIDVAGYISTNQDAQGNFLPSVDIDPELPDYIVDEVLDMCKEEVMKNYENQLGTQFAKDSVNENFK